MEELLDEEALIVLELIKDDELIALELETDELLATELVVLEDELTCSFELDSSLLEKELASSLDETLETFVFVQDADKATISKGTILINFMALLSTNDL